MTKQDCKFNFEWDYLGRITQDALTLFYTQNDWNRTLITKINQTSANICKATLIGGGNRILSHENLRPLIECLDFYNDGILQGRYIVDFYNPLDFKFGVDYKKNVENIIYIYNTKVFERILAVPVMYEPSEDNGSMPSVSFRNHYTDEEMCEYKKGFCGSVTVLNFNNYW